jgi:hypothetical protein
MSFFENINNTQSNLFSNNSTQPLSNSTSQNDKDKQGFVVFFHIKYTIL